MTARDPRIDPQAGDVLRSGVQTRTVLGRGVAKSVRFMREQGGHRLAGAKSIGCWQKWARNAEVLAQA